MERAESLEGRFGALLAGLLLGGATLWVVYVHAVVEVLPYDDAFITYRYAANIAEGRGAVYNAGERVFGSSAPLYLLWLVGLRGILPGWSIPDLAVRVNALWAVSAGLVAFLLVCRLSGSRLLAATGAAALMLHPRMLAVSTGGIESHLFLTLVLGACLAVAGARPAVAGALAGLALLTRLEGLALLPVVALAFRRSPRGLLVSLAAFGAVIAPWLLFASLQYGNPIPHSIIAKSRPVYPLKPGFGLEDAVGGLVELLSADAAADLQLVRGIAVGNLLLVAGVAAAVHTASRQRAAWAAAGFLGVTLVMYYGGNPLIFPWYWPHLYGSALVALLVGLPALAQLCRELAERRGSAGGRVVFALILATALAWPILATVLPYAQSGHGWRAPLRRVAEGAERLRVVAYREAAMRVERVAAAGDRVAAPEIGAFGFYYGGPVLDACGLVSPEALPFLPVPAAQRAGPWAGAISVDFVQATDPEWVVTLRGFAGRSLLRSGWFRARYGLVQRVPLVKPLWSSRHVLIFRRGAVDSAPGGA